jgi:serine/threonine-protein kinase
MYALGMVWYRTLTGRLPWSTSSRDELLMAHINQAPPRLAATVGLPSDLAELCARCLAKQAPERPTGAEFLAGVSSHDLLSHDLHGETVVAPTPSAEPAARTEPMAGPLDAVTQTQPAPAGRPVGSAAPGRRSRRDRLTLLAATMCGGLAVAVAYLLYGLKFDASGSAAAPIVMGSTAVPTTTSPHVDAPAAPTASPTTSSTTEAPVPPTSPTDDPGPTLVAAPAVTPAGTAVSGLGGTAWMSCPDRQTVVIESTTPNPGYTLTEARFGPGKDVRAVFVSGPRRTEIRGKCEAGDLQPQVVER